LDDPYNGNRSNHILKCKKFVQEEYKVEDVEFVKMRTIDLLSGNENIMNILKSIVILHKGKRVNIDSGFTLEQKKFFEKPYFIKKIFLFNILKKLIIQIQEK